MDRPFDLHNTNRSVLVEGPIVSLTGSGSVIP